MSFEQIMKDFEKEALDRLMEQAEHDNYPWELYDSADPNVDFQGDYKDITEKYFDKLEKEAKGTSLEKRRFQKGAKR